MAVIETKKLFDEFFSNKNEITIYKTKAQVDRAEVYAYEMKLGKSLFDMNENELFDMICSFKGVSNAKSPSFSKHVSNFRLVFQYYIENYDDMGNPFHSSKFRRLVSDSILEENTERLTYKDVEQTIQKVRSTYDTITADYYECLILLFYCGISEPKEVALIKETMINFRRKEIEIDGKVVRLSDRCFELLANMRSAMTLQGKKEEYLLEPWNGSYFKFPIRKSKIDEFKTLGEVDVGRKVSTMLNKNVASLTDAKISYRSLYLLGFYDYLVYKYGEARTKEMILSTRVNADNEIIKREMTDYGMKSITVGYLKISLKQFI